MSSLNVSEIKKHPDFIALVQKRHRLRVTMTGIMMLIFMSYLISWAFIPQFVNLRLPAGGAVSVGVWFSILVVLSALLLSGYYAIFAGKKLDTLNDQLLKKIGHSHDAQK